MATRYGCRPSDLVNSSWEDLLLDFRCYRAHLSGLEELFRKARADKDPIQKTFEVGRM